jgi:hypothetical protein
MQIASRLTLLTRIGFAARGLLYCVIAALLIAKGHAEDLTGALDYFSDGLGRVLLILMATGFAAYGLWRLSDAAFDIERHGSSAKGKGQRVAAGFIGGVYLSLFWKAVRLLQHATKSGAPEDGKDQAAQIAFSLPGGDLMLIAASGVLAGVGAFQLYKSWKASFLKHLAPQVADAAWAHWSGRLGYAARGVVFLISSHFLLRAGLDQRPTETGGMAEALAWLDSPWDLTTALGLLCFGLFSFVEARFRVLRDVPVDQLARKVTQLRSA